MQTSVAKRNYRTSSPVPSTSSFALSQTLKRKGRVRALPSDDEAEDQLDSVPHPSASAAGEGGGEGNGNRKNGGNEQNHLPYDQIGGDEEDEDDSYTFCLPKEVLEPETIYTVKVSFVCAFSFSFFCLANKFFFFPIPQKFFERDTQYGISWAVVLNEAPSLAFRLSSFYVNQYQLLERFRQRRHFLVYQGQKTSQIGNEYALLRWPWMRNPETLCLCPAKCRFCRCGRFHTENRGKDYTCDCTAHKAYDVSNIEALRELIIDENRKPTLTNQVKRPRPHIPMLCRDRNKQQ